ncbi:MAG: hypothetical protein ACKOXB_02815 [Flavobacteriales bacterium]
MDVQPDFSFEVQLEKKLRKQKWLLPAISTGTGILLYSGLIICLLKFEQGAY